MKNKLFVAAGVVVIIGLSIGLYFTVKPNKDNDAGAFEFEAQESINPNVRDIDTDTANDGIVETEQQDTMQPRVAKADQADTQSKESDQKSKEVTVTPISAKEKEPEGVKAPAQSDKPATKEEADKGKTENADGSYTLTDEAAKKKGEANSQPKGGDTKVENGITYVWDDIFNVWLETGGNGGEYVDLSEYGEHVPVPNAE